MLKESAVVIHYESGTATVKCQSQSACGQCAAKSACGNAALSELTGGVGEHIFSVETLTPLRVGQRVEIGLPERSLIQSVLLIYLFPLSVLLLGTLTAQYFFREELFAALFIFFCTALSFIVVRYLATKLQKKSAYKPILLKVISS
ncbi:SoxR reducing system RseC family protein [Caviibacterium pharyngocola]|uniref:Uncharacterized protein n=1 Tax=Caviibacterium pharyngocola TaxID=28159 RepID=A0A2M8RTI1_9PAST|nr:SoxR reducing system RseC family protein [Caviibacterium pharyngocola]PJG82185.1 hypothetical protein CVP04_10410 [Caviibacterium pharyngocola]